MLLTMPKKIGLLCAVLFLMLFAILVFIQARDPSSDAEFFLLFLSFPASAGITRLLELSHQCGAYLPGNCRLFFWLVSGTAGAGQAWIIGGTIAWLFFDRERPAS